MIPPLIVQRALQLGLQVIAVTDHNTVDNVVAVQQAAAGSGITILPGMEVQTREEVHILCLFDDMRAADIWQNRVYESLPALQNDAKAFGIQLAVDQHGELVRINERLLLTSTALTVEQVVEQVHALGGIAIAAHVDRPAYSLLANLGFIPDDLDIDAVEISAHATPDEVRATWPELNKWPLIRSSDAHRLAEMGHGSTFTLREPTIAEMCLAFAGRGGRQVWPSPSETVTDR